MVARPGPPLPAQERWVSNGSASLHTRTIGSGPHAIVLHGGPDLDHRYLLPDLDRLAEQATLSYYDQRGRGRSREGVDVDGITVQSEVEDLDAVRRQLGIRSAVLIAHSWGALLALEYALGHPDAVAGIAILNPGPLDFRAAAAMSASRSARLGPLAVRRDELTASRSYRAGDPAIAVERYRVHFARSLARSEDHERLMSGIARALAAQGAAGIRLARSVEARLLAQTWRDRSYDLIARLGAVAAPTTVLAGDLDPVEVAIATGIDAAIQRSELVVIEGCGHFAYLEQRERVASAFSALLIRCGLRAP